MSEVQVAAILDNVELAQKWNPARDRALFEVLYGCGLRVGELVGLDIEDIDRAECWIRLRGKGKRERAVPYLKGTTAKALEDYLAVRDAGEGVNAVFVNKHGRRLSDRGARNIVKAYGAFLVNDASIHPHSLRHAYATHLLDNGASVRSIQELLGHENLRYTARYTQVSMVKIMEDYDKAHPTAI